MARLPLPPTSLALAPLLLAGCISLGSEPPPYLLSLTPASKLADGATASGPAQNAITVLTPEIPRKLATPRIPVQTNNTEIAYVTGAQWVDSPHQLFAGLLSETIAARTGRLVLDQGQGLTDPGTRLAGMLVNFDVDATRSEVVVTYDATLVDGTNATKRRFEARAPVSAVEASIVGAALNRAANEVAVEVSDWLAG